MTLNLTGSPGVSYVLESTTNLVSSEGWQPVATNLFDLTGVWQFNDTSATNFAQRFYRLKYSQQYVCGVTFPHVLLARYSQKGNMGA